MEVEKRWCILRHSDSDMIGEIFSGKRKVYNASDGDVHPLPPFEFFIPFAEMKQKPVNRHASDEDDYKPYDAMLDERALRNDLHHFIFICATKEQVLSILDAPWVKVLKNRLYAYHDENGVPIEISHAEVERFKTIVKRFDFQILKGDPSEDVHEGDEVTVIDGPMAGSEGLVKAIRERDGQILLTVELSMFHEQMRLAVPGISIADVRLKTEKTRQLLQDPVIGRFEDELIELLCHLHGKKGSHQLNKEDQLQLRFLYQYSDIVFENNPVDQARFAALMLICAYLMGDKEQIARRSKEVEDLLVHGSLNEMSDVGSLKADVCCPLSVVNQEVQEVKENVEKDFQFSILNSQLEKDSQFSILNSQLEKDSSLFTLHSSLNEIAVYLIIALFIVTHKPELRKVAKVWVKSHPDCPLVIRRFLSIAKQIRC